MVTSDSNDASLVNVCCPNCPFEGSLAILLDLQVRIGVARFVVDAFEVAAEDKILVFSLRSPRRAMPHLGETILGEPAQHR